MASVLLLHSNKPGYVLLLIPPLALLPAKAAFSPRVTYRPAAEPLKESPLRAWLCTGMGLPTWIAREHPQARRITEGLHFQLHAELP